MNRYSLLKAGINASEGIHRFNGNAELYEKFLKQFAQDESFNTLCKAIQNRNVKAAFAAAHALKGVAGNLSMNRLHTDLFPLVEELRAGSLDRADALLRPVEADYQTIMSEIATL